MASNKAAPTPMHAPGAAQAKQADAA
eukprot:COSAG01_NODE_58942_length_303_cov_0.710784_1_plen_25_part_01